MIGTVALQLSARNVDLSVKASDSPDPVRAGNYLTNFISVTNVSSQVAAGVVINETLDPSVSFISAQPLPGAPVFSNGVLRCSIGTLNPGTGLRLTVVLMPNFAGMITNVASATTSDIDTNSANDTCSIATTVNDCPSIGIDDVTLQESDGETNAVFAVHLSARSDSALSTRFRTVTVNASSPPPAAAEVDYRATNGVLTFFPGTTNAFISVQVHGDDVYEYDEKFLVYLERNSGASIADDTGWCTILDDDPPQILATNPTVREGNSGSTSVVVQVSLSHPTERPLQGEFYTSAGTATAGGDYQSTGNYLFFDAGVTNQTLPFTIFGDTVHESNETFYVNVVLYSVGGAQGVCTILDDDFCFSPNGMRRTNGGFQFQVSGTPGSTYIFQGTTNFVNWIPLATNTVPTNGVLTFFDTTSILPHRCYRAQLH